MGVRVACAQCTAAVIWVLAAELGWGATRPASRAHWHWTLLELQIQPKTGATCDWMLHGDSPSWQKQTLETNLRAPWPRLFSAVELQSVEAPGWRCGAFCWFDNPSVVCTYTMQAPNVANKKGDVGV